MDRIKCIKIFFIAIGVKVYNSFKNTVKPSKLEWTILIAIGTLLFISHIYWDLSVTTYHGINVWNALAEGKIFNFYSFNKGEASYDFLVYVVFAIWNFPLWIAANYFNANVFSDLQWFIWQKAILIPFLLGSAFVIHKICLALKITASNANWVVFIFLSSGFVFSSVIVIGQYDIMSILFMMLGLLMLINGKNRKFVFWFAIAISFKLFALLIFIPLILIKEKKIIKLLGYSIVAISITLAEKLFFLIMDPAAKSAQAFTSNLVSTMVNENQIDIGVKSVSIYVFAFVGLCIFCYLKTPKSHEELNRFLVYIPFVSFALFFILTPAYGYWAVLMTPFFSIMIFQNKRNIKANLILDTILSASIIIVYQITWFWDYSIKTIKPMIIPKIFGAVDTLVKPLSANNLYAKILPGNSIPVLQAIFTACLIAILVLNYPKDEINSGEVIIERSVIWFRLFICAGVCAVPIIMYFVSLIVYGTK